VSHEVRHGDGIAGLLALPAGSVALVVNDPPWGCTKATWDSPLDWPAWWAAIDHALAPTGTLAVFASMKLAMIIGPIARRPFRYDLVWRKNRASGHLNAKRAPLRGHELLLVFGAAVYEPQITRGHRPIASGMKPGSGSLYGKERPFPNRAGKTDRYATSVLHFDNVSNDRGKGRLHATQKPAPLLRWLIRAYSKPGDLVADPTCGSGSTVHAARDEGRSAIGWDIHEPTVASASRWLASVDPLFTARAA
jgi:DNA modification methylase